MPRLELNDDDGERWEQNLDRLVAALEVPRRTLLVAISGRRA
jgi:hypothetical protein